MESMDQFTPRKGMDVYGSDSEKIGEVDEIQSDHFVVRKGFFFPEDHYIPLSAIASQTDDGIYLDVTKDQALEQQWNVAPTMDRDTASAVDTDRTTGLEHDPEPFPHEQDSPRTHVNREDDLHVDVHEEELVARRREVGRGDVDVHKRVVEQEAEVDVPVTEERVEVTRRAVDRDVEPGDQAFTEGTIEVPVHGEEVEVDKRAHVVEEIDVDKTAETHTERVRDTVRREEVEVEGEEIGTDDDRDRPI